MDKRTLAYNLLIGAVLLVAVAHTAIAFVFSTGLADVGALVIAVGLVGLALVNL
ncbi:hypothetical protein [Halorarius halobius]|uniref:hypothetical protein n=1 Tax=Halorarius halobius TaxID=2962671 RepID=UPI0020CD43E4|nr:hypothetical protein [Halorarius halobius]